MSKNTLKKLLHKNLKYELTMNVITKITSDKLTCH